MPGKNLNPEMSQPVGVPEEKVRPGGYIQLERVISDLQKFMNRQGGIQSKVNAGSEQRDDGSIVHKFNIEIVESPMVAKHQQQQSEQPGQPQPSQEPQGQPAMASSDGKFVKMAKAGAKAAALRSMFPADFWKYMG